MSRPNIHPTIVYRIPQFSYQSKLYDCWEELKASIAISSADFYEQVKDLGPDELQNMPPKLKHTVWKYFNRAKYRSTPYGSFAGFGLIEKADTNAHTLIIDNKQTLHALTDWPERNKLEYTFEDVLAQNLCLFANSSYYYPMGSIRYITCTDNQFNLQDIDQDPQIDTILKACSIPLPVNTLLEQLASQIPDREALLELIEGMIGAQLLITEKDPNIIGEDYFTRINLKTPQDSPKYYLTERKMLSGDIDRKMLSHLPALIVQLKNAMRPQKNETLETFVQQFLRRFEQNEIPLMHALDPEMGIGYGGLEQDANNEELINGFRHREQKDPEAPFNHLKTSLAKQLKFVNGQETIILNDQDFAQADEGAPLANSISAMVTLAGNLVYIDSIGGSTANALNGRFTLASESMHRHTRSVALQEQQANPDVLFFDVAYTVENVVDNINRRASIYDYQLSILNYDTSANPLTLDDIYVSVQNNNVILRSKKLNKRLVPRMTSAYNHVRSDLSLFRLLCDLRGQGLCGGVALDIKTMFPELSSYPRLQYKNIVLSRAGWNLEIKTINNGVKVPAVEQIREYLKGLNVSRYFKTGLSDQTLTFDMEDDMDLEVLGSMLQKQKTLYAEEVILPDNCNIKDAGGKPYLGQFILSLHHNQAIYSKAQGREHHPAKNPVTEFYPPGSEWLYFEIFCHPQRADQLLTDYIDPFLQRYQQFIKKFFFIRYNENGDHIRLRFLLHDVKDGYLLTSQFSAMLQLHQQNGLVADLQLKTYKRELQRYGKDNIEAVESHFCLDSKYVLSLLDNPPSAIEKYQLCCSLIGEINASGVVDELGIKQLIERFSKNFTKEHQVDAGGFGKLNAEYKNYKNAALVVLNADQQFAFDEFKCSLINVLQNCNASAKASMMGDLIHMHVNRLFSKDQRTHEMVMYYFALKELQREKAMSATQAG